MGKGGFRVAKKGGTPAVAKQVKTFGHAALELCGFLKFGEFGDLPRAPSFGSDVNLYEEIVVEEGKGKEKEESEEERKEKEEKEENEEMEFLMREFEMENRMMDLVDDLEEYLFFEKYSPLWLEKESAKWEWTMFGKKWQRKGPALRERRTTHTLKKEKFDPKRYVRSRAPAASGSNFTLQPRSLENYLPKKKWPKKTTIAPVTQAPQPSRSRRVYVPSDYPVRVAPVVDRWEPIPASILPPQNPRLGNQVARQHQANRSNLDSELKKALESSVVAVAPSGKRYTPEQAARMLIEMQSREITPEDFALLSILDECLQKKTVEEDALEKLPVGLWKDVKESPDGGSSSDAPRQETCRICLLEYDDADELCTLPCSHIFHKNCIREWLSGSSTSCPLDGQEVVASA